MDRTNATRGYGIGEVSRRTGVNIETIRYYERIEILPRPGRTEGGNRQYDHEQLKRLFFVKRCRDLGFSLDEIRALLEMVDRDDFTCNDVHAMTITHLAAVKTKLADLKRLERALVEMASQCSGGDVPDCPIIDTLFQPG
ncbi:Heavy metal resistance transcriptional regulator HmrR [hydrothermal vent metagenome]|uniref:Heavy metal resistance transcriptional regulator HmrR n=1 Tax=hydrothermal vent metagenome TaxID=652676 RepID=A0A3B0THT4_9ZZZZ